MFEEKDDNILARWLAGELTEAEQAEFEKDETFLEYQQIAQGMEGFKKPEINKEALHSKLHSAIDLQSSKKGKVINLRVISIVSGIAASIMLVIGLFFNEISYTAPIGKHLSVNLPDGTLIELNADSKLTRKRFFWNNNKVVNLEGEGFFDVTKGKGFQVKTTSGITSVLGTQFNIIARNQRFGMVCYEGKVRFEAEHTKEKVILEKGDAIAVEDNTITKEKTNATEPSWRTGTSAFNNVLFIDVVDELERQYGVTVQEKETVGNNRFTGSFVHDNLNIALKTVFTPMGLEYHLSEDGKTIIVNTP